MEKKFMVVIGKKGDQFEAHCEDLPDIIFCGRNEKEALEKIKAAIIKKLGGDSDAGSAPVSSPVSPPPRDPIIELCKKPDV